MIRVLAAIAATAAEGRAHVGETELAQIGEIGHLRHLLRARRGSRAFDVNGDYRRRHLSGDSGKGVLRLDERRNRRRAHGRPMCGRLRLCVERRQYAGNEHGGTPYGKDERTRAPAGRKHGHCQPTSGVFKECECDAY